MTDLADTPRHEQERWPARAFRWAAVALTGLVFTSLSWGVYVDTIQGLAIDVTFSGYQSVTPHGEYIYSSSKRNLNYQITLKNRANMTFSQVQAQVSLHSEGGVCGDKKLDPGTLLPGQALSEVHTFNASPGSDQIFEGVYTPPDGCAVKGFLKVRILYTYSGRMYSTTVTCPAHFKLN